MIGARTHWFLALLWFAAGALCGYVACQLKWEAWTEEADRSGRTLAEVR